jgi:hypothetical protein
MPRFPESEIQACSDGRCKPDDHYVSCEMEIVESAGTHVFDGEFSWSAGGLLAEKLFSREGKPRVRTCAGPIALKNVQE